MRFTIRAASQGDLDAMAAVAQARATWRGRGVADWDGWHRYAHHVTLPSWVVIDRYGALAGFTYPHIVEAPEPCSNGSIRPTLSISLSCTHPRFARHHPGALIAPLGD